MIFKSITNIFQLKFKDRIWAANILAEGLKELIKRDKTQKEEITILGIPRGGVITADRVAQKLSIPDTNFDIVIPRKIGAPHNKELGVGAVMEDGSLFIDNELVQKYEVADLYIEREKNRQLEEIKRRKQLYRLPSDKPYDIDGRSIILVDDGAATGGTLIVAARWLKKSYEPKKLIIAVPVVPKPILRLLQNECDKVEVVTKPKEYFNSVGQYYRDFTEVTDEGVIEIMHKRRALV